MHLSRTWLSCWTCLLIGYSVFLAAAAASDEPSLSDNIFEQMSADEVRQAADRILREMNRQITQQVKPAHNKLVQEVIGRIQAEDPSHRDDYWQVCEIQTRVRAMAVLREHVESTPGVPPTTDQWIPVRAGRMRNLSEAEIKADLLTVIDEQEAAVREQLDELIASVPLQSDLTAAMVKLGTVRGNASVLDANHTLLETLIRKDDISELQRALWLMGGARILETAYVPERLLEEGMAAVPAPAPATAPCAPDASTVTVTPSSIQPAARVPAMVPIRGGTFTMGPSVRQPAGSQKPEGPVRVTVDSFWLGKYEITAAEYCRFLNAVTLSVREEDKAHRYVVEPTSGRALIRLWDRCTIEWAAGHFQPKPNCARRPANSVSWYGAVEYCRWLSRTTGKTYRLPTEAEWEYAARGKEGRLYPWGGSEVRTDYANIPGHWQGSIEKTIAKVGTWPKDHAPEGLYDLVGGVREWCSDWMGDLSAYDGKRNPQGPSTGQYKALRGGGFINPDFWDALKLTYRGSGTPTSTLLPTYGFRVARSADGSASQPQKSE